MHQYLSAYTASFSQYGPTVIIPVFNAATAVAACLASVARYTPAHCRVVIIDDASTDAAIQPLLQRYASRPGFSCYRNPSNYGFTATVNRGFLLAGLGDVVLLNSDTQVNAGWLTRLITAAYSAENIGTVTPFSNNADAFSAPQPGLNSIPRHFSPAQFARAIAQTSSRYYPQVPTGNGFCMYIRRACLEETGTLDEQVFPRGYGEENDFCRRAAAKGWQHIIDDATYIYHQSSASFGNERTGLIATGLQKLEQRYPDYHRLVQQAFSAPTLHHARNQVATLAEWQPEYIATVKPRVLILCSNPTGLLSLTALHPELDCWLLEQRDQQLWLQRWVNSEWHTMAEYQLSHSAAWPGLNREFAQIVLHWQLHWCMEALICFQPNWQQAEVIRQTRTLAMPCTLSFSAANIRDTLQHLALSLTSD